MSLPLVERFKRFYRRNDLLFWCTGLIVLSHILWWEIQQNRAFVSKRDRVERIGPFKLPYLDETDFYKRRGLTSAQNNDNSSASKPRD